MIIPEITLDTRGAEAALGALAGSIEAGFPRVVQDTAQRTGRSIELNFRQGGRPDPFAHLAESTIKARKAKAARTGIRPAAGFETPLRFTDALYKAAIAQRAGVPGSNIRIGPWSFSHELLMDYASIQDARRPFYFFQEADVETFTDLLLAEMRARCRRAEAGTI